MDIGRSIFLDKQSQDFSAAYNSRNQICNTQVVVPNLLTYLLMTLLFKKVGTYFSWYRYCLSHQFSYSWITKEQHTRDWNAVLFPLHPQLFERHNFSSFGVSGSVHNPVRTLAYSKTRVWSYCQKLLLAEGTGGGGEPPPLPSYSYKGGNRKNWPIERGKIYI